VARWETVGRVLQNAFLKPIVPGYEPARSPKGGPPAATQGPVASDHPAREPEASGERGAP
jgi:hypothetical protein